MGKGCSEVVASIHGWLRQRLISLQRSHVLSIYREQGENGWSLLEVGKHWLSLVNPEATVWPVVSWLRSSAIPLSHEPQEPSSSSDVVVKIIHDCQSRYDTCTRIRLPFGWLTAIWKSQYAQMQGFRWICGCWAFPNLRQITIPSSSHIILHQPHKNIHLATPPALLVVLLKILEGTCPGSEDFPEIAIIPRASLTSKAKSPCRAIGQPHRTTRPRLFP